jgi:hypothetical protein
MPELEIWLMALALVGLALGTWGIVWARFSQISSRSLCGRGMFVVAIVSLAVTSSVAAFHRAEGLVPLGLTAGLLVVGMLWEVPPQAEREGPEIVAEET